MTGATLDEASPAWFSPRETRNGKTPGAYQQAFDRVPRDLKAARRGDPPPLSYNGGCGCPQ